MSVGVYVTVFRKLVQSQGINYAFTNMSKYVFNFLFVPLIYCVTIFIFELFQTMVPSILVQGYMLFCNLVNQLQN